MTKDTEANTQAPAFHRRRVGEAVVTAVSDGFLNLPPQIMLGLEEAEMRAMLAAAFQPMPLPTALNTFVIQHAGRTVLVDAGAGTTFGPTTGKMATNLAAAGVSPDKVDTVLITHLHGDHLGGLTTPAGTPAFPNAELVVAEAETAFWLDPANEARAPEARRPSFAAARAAVAAYGTRVRKIGAGVVLPGIDAHPLPGHTPGHTGFMVKSGEDALLIWGDVFHLPDIQAPRPEIGLVFDTDPALAARTRAAVLDMVAADRLLVAGAHMHFPGFAHIAREGAAYRVVPATWSYAV